VGWMGQKAGSRVAEDSYISPVDTNTHTGRLMMFFMMPSSQSCRSPCMKHQVIESLCMQHQVKTGLYAAPSRTDLGEGVMPSPSEKLTDRFVCSTKSRLVCMRHPKSVLPILGKV
jgi:hypothetical protein